MRTSRPGRTGTVRMCESGGHLSSSFCFGLPWVTLGCASIIANNADGVLTFVRKYRRARKLANTHARAHARTTHARARTRRIATQEPRFGVPIADDAPLNRFGTRSEQGPRHFVFHPTLRVLYTSNEQGNSVSAYAVGADGKLTASGEPTSTVPVRIHDCL